MNLFKPVSLQSPTPAVAAKTWLLRRPAFSSGSSRPFHLLLLFFTTAKRFLRHVHRNVPVLVLLLVRITVLPGLSLYGLGFGRAVAVLCRHSHDDVSLALLAHHLHLDLHHRCSVVILLFVVNALLKV